ncbi:hypothetical protein [Leptospira bandrabouensis]|uniref:Uncharacterized protein n=1 Tax=Leptospira bandrabouensis TaxID=2484903 RepID=A0A6H3NV86_9LEPT|nr:hypothetical protein [Leptospira bandrabouensis]MCG6153979.1 hypothetical protein [Leptospira bandrabouensis]TGN06698.1 hypothetical protein EHR07_07010 [Leptospira bandrabouensis]TGN13653.1 hypothetical protein EHR08_11085 [Leptospira bandrabouensis]
MGYPNNMEYMNEFSERVRSYLILIGIQNEYKISEILSDFFKSTELKKEFHADWKLWQSYLTIKEINPKNLLPIASRSWQFGSMIPQSAEWKRDTKAKKQSIISSLKPLFIIASIFLWSLLYYLIIFRLL